MIAPQTTPATPTLPANKAAGHYREAQRPVLDIGQGDQRRRVYPHEMQEPIFANDGLSVPKLLIYLGTAIALAFVLGAVLT